MRVDPRSRRSACERGAIGLVAETRLGVMDRCVDLGRPDELRPELGRAGMQTTPLPDGRVTVERLPKELMAEVVVADILRSEWVEHAVLDELLERVVEGRHREVHDPGEHVGHEAAPHDGPGAGDGLRLGAQSGGPGEHGVLDRVRDVDVADGDGGHRTAGADGGHELLDMERHPVRSLVDGLDDFPRGRQVAAHEEADHGPGLR